MKSTDACHEKGRLVGRPFLFVDLPMMPVAAMVKPRTIESRTAIVGEGRANHATIANNGIIRLAVISAVVCRRITAVIGWRISAIVPVAGTIGVRVRGQSADH